MSRFDALAKRSTQPGIEEVTTGSARRGNPAYRQFSAYIPTDLYRKVKVQLAEHDLDLSAAVEQALAEWIERRTNGSK